jgi:hypothetical protein
VCGADAAVAECARYALGVRNAPGPGYPCHGHRSRRHDHAVGRENPPRHATPIDWATSERTRGGLTTCEPKRRRVRPPKRSLRSAG